LKGTVVRDFFISDFFIKHSLFNYFKDVVRFCEDIIYYNFSNIRDEYLSNDEYEFKITLTFGGYNSI